MVRDLDYETNNIGYSYQYPEETGGGIKCKNYELCETILPIWWYDCKGCYLCINCLMLSGIFEMFDNVECPICLDVKRSVKLKHCQHTICIDCYKRCHYGLADRTNEPNFPYPDIEDEYDNDTENPKWGDEYPLIKIYNDEWNRWYDEKDVKYENEGNLRKCPICRV